MGIQKAVKKRVDELEKLVIDTLQFEENPSCTNEDIKKNLHMISSDWTRRADFWRRMLLKWKENGVTHSKDVTEMARYHFKQDGNWKHISIYLLYIIVLETIFIAMPAWSGSIDVVLIFLLYGILYTSMYVTWQVVSGWFKAMIVTYEERIASYEGE